MLKLCWLNPHELTFMSWTWNLSCLIPSYHLFSTFSYFSSFLFFFLFNCIKYIQSKLLRAVTSKTDTGSIPIKLTWIQFCLWLLKWEEAGACLSKAAGGCSTAVNITDKIFLVFLFSFLQFLVYFSSQHPFFFTTNPVHFILLCLKKDSCFHLYL